jgi:hypothetical protein
MERRSLHDDHRYNYTDTISVASFRGGGTYFVGLNDTLQVSLGSMLAHPSKLYHAGAEITEGRRYILVGFVNVDHWHVSEDSSDNSDKHGNGLNLRSLIGMFPWRAWGELAECITVHYTDSNMADYAAYKRTSPSANRLTEEEADSPMPSITKSNIQQYTVCQSFLHVVGYAIYHSGKQIFDSKTVNDYVIQCLIVMALCVCVCVLAACACFLCSAGCKEPVAERAHRKDF